MRKFIYFFIILTVLTGTCVPFEFLQIQTVSAQTVLDSFEEDTSSLWYTLGGGSATQSSEHAKEGTYSLKWDFEASSVLGINNSELFNMIKNTKNNHGIKLWIYNENPTDDHLVFKIGETMEVAENPIYEFTYNLNFSGWRALWARVNFVAASSLYSGRVPDAMEIVAPSGVKSGTLWFDMFEVSDNVMYSATADNQMPYIVFHNNSPYQFSQNVPTKPLEQTLSAEYKKAFDEIKAKVNEYIMPTDVDYNSLLDSDSLKIRYRHTQSGIKNAISSYDKYGIKREANGYVTGPGLFASMDEHSPKFSDFEKAWVALALDYKMNKNEDSKRKILELFDFFNDQGWAAGSSCGSINLDDITGDGYAYAVFLMKDELKEAGIFEREMATLKWRSEFGVIYGFDDVSEDYSIYVDKMRSVIIYQLLYILSQDDTPEKLRDMQYYTEYLQKVVNPRPGHRGGIKPDGTMWHHCAPYMSAYGASGILGLTMIKYFINGTCFDIDAEATEKIKKALMTYEDSCHGQDMHPALGGRFPENSFGLMTNEIIGSLIFMAMCGDIDITRVFLKYYTPENEMLNPLYTRNLNRFMFTNTLGQIKLMQSLEKEARENGYSPKDETELNRVYPYGGYNVHKHDGWMATTKGYSQYIWDFEFGGGQNTFGRYVSYGTTLLYSGAGAKASGIDIENGWDWNRWPGATTKHLNLPELKSTLHRYFSDETFLGGVSSENNGVYSMKIHDMAYDSSFRFNKTLFYFGDEIICLGSDIYCDDSQNNIETTIFQSNMGEDTQKPFCFNSSDAIFEFPYSESIEENKTVWFSDPYGNGFIIPDSKGLKIERGPQSSVSKNGITETCGNYTTAYINHGKSPQGAGYEYVILPQKSPDEIKKRAENPDYRVLKRDSGAHIVKNKSYKSIGYALFDPDIKLEYGVFKSSNVPCIAMETEKSKNEISFTFSDPDLRMGKFAELGQINTKNEVQTPSQINCAEVVLNGCWKLSGEDADGVTVSKPDYEANTTTLSFECVDGKQFEINLKADIPIEWKIGNPEDSSQNYASFGEWNGREYYYATNAVNVFTGSTASANPSLKPYYATDKSCVEAIPVDDGTLGRIKGDRSILFNVTGASDNRNRLVWGTVTSTGRTESEQIDTIAYVVESKMRISENADVARIAINYYNSPTAEEGKTEPSSMNHHNLLYFKDGKICYFPITGDAANGKGSISNIPEEITGYEFNRWYTVTMVIECDMANASLARYSMYIDGERIVSDMPLCNAMYNQKSDSIQQYPFFGIRGFQFYTHLGTTSYDDYKVFRIINGSLSADATVSANAKSGYEVNDKSNKICNIPAGTTVEEFINNITSNDKNVPYSSLFVTNANGEEMNCDSVIADGMMLESISPNTVTRKTYTLLTSDAKTTFGNVTLLNNGRQICSGIPSEGTLVAEVGADIPTNTEPQSANIILAFYTDDNTLDEVLIQNLMPDVASTKLMSDVINVSADESRTVRAFLWGDGLRPLAIGTDSNKDI